MGCHNGEILENPPAHEHEQCPCHKFEIQSRWPHLASGSQDGTVLLWNIDTILGPVPITPSGITSNANTSKNKAILAEEKTEFSNHKSEIQQICKKRCITTLFHFTRIENLQSILHEGLIGRSILETRGKQFLWNDNDRSDCCPQATCLSISFPNYKMFWEIRKTKEKAEGIKDSQWVVLLLDAKVLWELDCAFCRTKRRFWCSKASSVKRTDR